MPPSNGNEMVFLAGGDCGPVHGPDEGYPLERYAEGVRPVFASADLRFANCERQYSANAAPGGRTSHGCQPPQMAGIFTEFGIDVLSLANNHMYDAGEQALLDTRALMLRHRIAVSGAGKNLAEAREPAIVTRKGITVGFISYCSALPKGSEAGPDKAGVAPLRVLTEYEHRGPHAGVRVITHPDPQDLRMLLDDITALRPRVDILIVSLHGGVIWVPRVVADYQVMTAHAAIDAGADMILGHHAHITKAIEVYKGKAIFHGLCHLCMTKPEPGAAWHEVPWKHGALRNHQDLDPAYPLLPYGSHATRTLVAKAIFTKDGVKSVSFLPMIIDAQYRPQSLKRDDPRFDEVTRYMEWASEGFAHTFTPQHNEVKVTE
mgnify:CR=1 FL=1